MLAINRLMNMLIIVSSVFVAFVNASFANVEY